MIRVALSVALVTLPGLARAQPAAPTQPAPSPAAPAQPAPQTPPAPDAPASPPAPTEPAPPTPAPPPPTAAETPVLVVAPEEKPAKPTKPAVTATYDQGLQVDSDDGEYGLKLTFSNQVRFETTRSLDEETPARHNQFLSHFLVPRTRFSAAGHMFGKANQFGLQVSLGDAGSFAFFKDMWIQRQLAPKLFVRAGQWKHPFNRTWLVSAFTSTFNERSIENDLAGASRSVGVALHDNYEKSPEGIEWVAGVFNSFSGSGDRPQTKTTCIQAASGMITCTNGNPTTVPDDFGPTLAFRVGYNSRNIKGYSEGDLEGGPLRYAVGASYKVDLANFAKGTESSWSHAMSHGLEVDTMIKAMGFGLDAGVLMMRLKNPATDPAQGPQTQYGFYVQPSYMVLPKRVEVGARFAMITVTVPATAMAPEVDRKQLEARGAFNYFVRGHAFKLASDFGFVMFTGDTPAPDRPDVQIRIMLQAVL